MKQRARARPEAAPERTRWGVVALGVVLLAAEVVVLPGSASAFRLPKEAVALAGLALLAALGMAARLLNGRLALHVNLLTVTLLAYPVLLAASAAWSAEPHRALASAAAAAVWVVAVLWLGTFDEEDRRRLLGWAIAGALVSAAVMLLQLAGAGILALAPGSGRGRMGLTGLTGNPADLAMAAVLLLPLVLATTALEGSTRRRWVVAAILAATAAIAQSLTGLVALVSLAATWTLLRGSRRLRIAAAGALLVLVAVALASGVATRLRRNVDQLKSGNLYFLLSAREDGWTAALEMIRTHPVVGVGAGHFTHAFFPSRLAWLERRAETGHRGEMATHFEWAHCDPLQRVAELGLFGVVWLVLLGFALGRSRSRGDPLLPLAVATFAPFALLHYPGHLAVSLIPATLVLARLTAAGRSVDILPRRPMLRSVLAVALVLAGGAVTVWQVRRVQEARWQGRAELALDASQAKGGRDGAALAWALARQIEKRLADRPGEAPTLRRLEGRARLAAGDAAGAEPAFREAMALWPHEEAEFGLGLALAARGQRSAAVHHLCRVCRINPDLVNLITDQDLQAAVRDYLAVFGAEPRLRRRPPDAVRP